MPPRSTIRILSPEGSGARLYAGISFWPADAHQQHTVTMTIDGTGLPAQSAPEPGDQFLEWKLPTHAAGFLQIGMVISPPCAEAHWPALRIVGIAPEPAA